MLHFISGLPRSGSTLLAAILNQNPRFQAGMASPVAQIYYGLEVTMSQANESSIFITNEQRKATLKGLFNSFYPGLDNKVIFDNNRMWLARLPALMGLYPDAKVITTVRDLAWIIDSFERLKQNSPYEPSGVYGYDSKGTIYDRAKTLSHGMGVVGYSLNALREALAGEYSNRVFLVEYDDLCSNPVDILEAIYSFIDEPLFSHDFENVSYNASEFDKSVGAKGLHDINGRVETRSRKTILPPDIFNRYKDDQFWREIPVKTDNVYPFVRTLL